MPARILEWAEFPLASENFCRIWGASDDFQRIVLSL